MKKFNIKSAGSTALAYAVGGAANAGMDYAVENVEFLKGLTPSALGLIKIAVGVAGRSFFKQSIVEQAADGVGIAGAGDVLKEIMAGTFSLTSDDSNSGSETTAGLPKGTIGRIRRTAGNRAFMRAGRKVSGIPMSI